MSFLCRENWYNKFSRINNSKNVFRRELMNLSDKEKQKLATILNVHSMDEIVEIMLTYYEKRLATCKTFGLSKDAKKMEKNIQKIKLLIRRKIMPSQELLRLFSLDFSGCNTGKDYQKVIQDEFTTKEILCLNRELYTSNDVMIPLSDYDCKFDKVTIVCRLNELAERLEATSIYKDRYNLAQILNGHSLKTVLRAILTYYGKEKDYELFESVYAKSL